MSGNIKEIAGVCRWLEADRRSRDCGLAPATRGISAPGRVMGVGSAHFGANLECRLNRTIWHISKVPGSAAGIPKDET